MLQKFVILVFCLVAITDCQHVQSESCNNVCGERYCTVYKALYECPLIKCAGGSAVLVKPELCRCCPGCYRVVGKYIIGLH